MNGIINVLKPPGMTSQNVVSFMRRMSGIKKIGHSGTLDPYAAGVLPIFIGKATRLVEYAMQGQKEYIGEIYFGLETDTLDSQGKVISRQSGEITKEQFQSVLESTKGTIYQRPPMYSALKVNGRKLYELAREGKEVERKPRKVTLYEIKILEMNLPLVRFSVTCSKGTYIRTLCHDIGAKLGCGGCMESLLRTQVERFMLKDSMKLSAIEAAVKAGTFDTHLVTIEEMFSHYEEVVVPKEMDKLLHNGNKVPAITHQNLPDKTRVRMYDSNRHFIGIYEYQKRRECFGVHTIFFTPQDF